MNIWIFNQYAVTPDLPGGTRHYDLGQELARRGHHVVIIATSFHHHMHKETRLKPGERLKIEDVNGVKFVWLRTPPYWRNDWRRVWNMLVFALRAWWLGRRLFYEVGKTDVVIGSSPPLFVPLAVYWIARHYGVPFVMEVRDLWPQTLIDMGALREGWPITKALRTLEKFLYRKSEKIISLLPFAYEYISALGIHREKIVWIPNGVDLTRFKELLSTDGFLSEEFKVMYLGAHGQANALDVLIQAAKVIHDRGLRKIRFILLGDGPEKPRLIRLAQSWKVGNIEFRQPVPKSEVPKLLREADAFIFSLEEVKVFRYGISPNKLFDYMSVAKPIIFAVNASNNPIEEAHCGLTVPPRDPQALAEAVIRLYQMPKEEREAMGRRGRAYVEEYHDIQKLSQRLECVLLEVVQKRCD